MNSKMNMVQTCRGSDRADVIESKNEESDGYNPDDVLFMFSSW